MIRMQLLKDPNVLFSVYYVPLSLDRSHDPDAAAQGSQCSVCRLQEPPPPRAQDHPQNPGQIGSPPHRSTASETWV